MADLTNLPFADQSFDVLLNIFSPSNYREFDRSRETVDGHGVIDRITRLLFVQGQSLNKASAENVHIEFRQCGLFALRAHERIILKARVGDGDVRFFARGSRGCHALGEAEHAADSEPRRRFRNYGVGRSVRFFQREGVIERQRRTDSRGILIHFHGLFRVRIAYRNVLGERLIERFVRQRHRAGIDGDGNILFNALIVDGHIVAVLARIRRPEIFAQIGGIGDCDRTVRGLFADSLLELDRCGGMIGRSGVKKRVAILEVLAHHEFEVARRSESYRNGYGGLEQLVNIDGAFERVGDGRVDDRLRERD